MVSSTSFTVLVFSLLFASSFLCSAYAGSFTQDIDLSWGDGRGKILDNGKLLTLSLDKYSGSGFQSKNEYIFGKIDIQIKLVAGNSAGTVTTFYVSVISFSIYIMSFHNYKLKHLSKMYFWLHMFLPIVVIPRANTRWDRLWIPRKRQRTTLHSAHQCVCKREGQSRATVPPVVRPNQGLSHLLYPMESAAYHVRKLTIP